MREKNMERGDKVEYIGKGFLGYKKDVEMVFLSKDSFNSVWVMYGDIQMIVSPHEIKIKL